MISQHDTLANPKDSSIPQPASSTSRKSATMRTVRVAVPEHEPLEISLPGEQLTCQWLLDAVSARCISLMPDATGKVVALRTGNCNETMDFYLTLGERVLPPLSNNDTLIVYRAEPEERQREKRKEDFEIIKMIGKGGFSNVYEGKRVFASF